MREGDGRMQSPSKCLLSLSRNINIQLTNALQSTISRLREEEELLKAGYCCRI